MINSIQKKYFHPFIAALLVLAVFGSLAFLGAEMPHAFEMGGSKPYSKSAFTPFDHSVKAQNLILSFPAFLYPETTKS